MSCVVSCCIDLVVEIKVHMNKKLILFFGINWLFTQGCYGALQHNITRDLLRSSSVRLMPNAVLVTCKPDTNSSGLSEDKNTVSDEICTEERVIEKVAKSSVSSKRCIKQVKEEQELFPRSSNRVEQIKEMIKYLDRAEKFLRKLQGDSCFLRQQEVSPSGLTFSLFPCSSRLVE